MTKCRQKATQEMTCLTDQTVDVTMNDYHQLEWDKMVEIDGLLIVSKNSQTHT